MATAPNTPAPSKGQAQAQAQESAETESQARQERIAQLIEQRDEFVRRLDTGAEKIEEARSQGKNVTTWEDHWIYLLRQYEAVCDKLQALDQQC